METYDDHFDDNSDGVSTSESDSSRSGSVPDSESVGRASDVALYDIGYMGGDSNSGFAWSDDASRSSDVGVSLTKFQFIPVLYLKNGNDAIDLADVSL